MKDISGPVVAIALILAAVFVPGWFYTWYCWQASISSLPLPIAISVLISAFVALSLTPALCSLLLRPEHPDEKSKGFLNRFFYHFNNWFARVTNSYSNGVKENH
jgi:HAE1 family hydrophobic/amphiphilic exporter-1